MARWRKLDEIRPDDARKMRAVDGFWLEPCQRQANERPVGVAGVNVDINPPKLAIVVENRFVARREDQLRILLERQPALDLLGVLEIRLRRARGCGIATPNRICAPLRHEGLQGWGE